MEQPAYKTEDILDKIDYPAAGERQRKRWFGFGGKKKQPTAADRRHTRHECLCAGVVTIANSSIAIEGVVIEVSKGGVKFRPAKTYLLERKNVQIFVEFEGIHRVGKIVATRPDGYGIALFEELEDDQITSLISKETDFSITRSEPHQEQLTSQTVEVQT